MGRKELKLTQSVGICLRMVLHEYRGLIQKGEGQGQATKGHYKISRKHAVRHMFYGSFCTWISIEVVIEPFDVI